MRHALLFGITDKTDMRTLASWESLFIAAGYLPAELDEASRHLAGNLAEILAGEGRYLGKMPAHLAAIQQRIRQRRAVTYSRQVEEFREDRGTCTICQGGGTVPGLPHLGGIRDGQWVPMNVARGGPAYYTQAVTCSCPLGRWFNQHRPPDRALMSLEEYQAKNPRWQLQLWQRQRELLAQAALTPADTTWQELMARLAEGWGVRQPGEDG